MSWNWWTNSPEYASQGREQLIKAIAGLYCAAWLDCARASFNRCTADGSDASLVTHIKELKQLLARYENAVKLLTCRPFGCASGLRPWHNTDHLAIATAQALHEAFDALIRPTLRYENDIRPALRYEKNGLRAPYIQTEFTPEQWMSHLHLACSAALGQAPDFPPLPRLEGDENSGYILRLYDLDAAQLHVSSAPQNQSGALRRAC